LANNLEAAVDAQQTVPDSQSASAALVNEANNEASNDRNPSKASDAKSSEETSAKHVDSMFGVITVGGDQTNTKDAAKEENTTPAKNAPPKENAPPGDAPPPLPPAEQHAYTIKVPVWAEADPAAWKTIRLDPKLAGERNQLNAEITKQEKGLDKKSDQFSHLEMMRSSMNIIEARGACEHPPLSADEIARTYKAVSHLIETKDGPDVPLNQHDRNDVALQILLHAADPNTVDQGRHLTCNVNTVESRLFTKNPAAAASLIEQVATTSQYHPTNNPSDTIKIDRESLKRPGDGEESHFLPSDGDRSYASRIFQVTAVNAFYHSNMLSVKNEKGQTMTYLPGAVEYRQGKPDPNATPPTSGETLYDVTTNPPQPIKDGTEVIHQPNLLDDDIFQIYNTISDRPESNFMVFNKDFIAGEGKSVTQISSEAELKQSIEQAQKNGKLPIILGVNSGQEPFYSDSHAGAAGGAGGSHVVNITGIDKDGKAIVNNGWGQASKHSVDMHELYIATLTPADAVSAIKKDCAKNAKDGKVDFSTEAELLRLRRASGDLQKKDHEYIEELTWLSKQAAKDAVDNRGGVLDARTELELHNQLEAEKKGKSWQWMKDQIWEGPLNGIMYGNGVLRDDNGKPVELSADYNTRQMDYAAKTLYDAGDANVYFNQDDYQKMDKVLANKSPAEIQQMDNLFKAKYGTSMEDYIKDRFKRHPEERDQALKLLYQAQRDDS
jgi:hypothetical protein